MTLAEYEKRVARRLARQRQLPATCRRKRSRTSAPSRGARAAADVRAHPVVTTGSGIDALRLKLWDEERGCLVGYPARRARPAAATEPVEEPLKSRAEQRIFDWLDEPLAADGVAH